VLGKDFGERDELGVAGALGWEESAEGLVGWTDGWKVKGGRRQRGGARGEGGR